MRILAIRGRNLASLEGEFAVDFGAEPLANAGVYAISGPTGAGKTTLLDALCLALYHDTPRLSAATEINVSVPDVKDQTLTPRDPRNLLRRGCGEGYAEVDFVDRSGLRWRARWSVARARGKPGGALQQVQATLSEIETGAQFPGRRGEIQSKLVELTGLSFEQFGRSVLLAQNEFAALLKAPQRERADLLEALTGTEIFQRISQLAHARQAQERAELLAQEQALRQITPLGDSERAELDARHDELQRANQLNQSARAALDAELSWHRRGAALQQRQRDTEAREQLAAAALLAERDLHRQLQRWQAVAPLRPLAELHRQTVSAADALIAALPALEAISQATAADVAHCAHELGASVQARDAQRARRETARPLIAAVRAADQTVQQANAQLTQAEDAHAQGLRRQQRLHAGCDQIAQRLPMLEQQLQRWEQWRRAQPLLDSAPDRWSTLGSHLGSAGRCAALLAEREAELSRLADTDARLSGATLAAQGAHDRALADARATQQALQAREAELADLDAQAPPARRAQWQAQRRDLDQAQQALADYRGAAQRQRLLSEQIAALRAQRLQAQTALSAASAALDAAEQSARDARGAAQRASLIADAHTEQLRQLLQPGEPCPVCGATEHPAAGAGDAAVRALLEALAADATAQAQRLSAAQASVQTATTELMVIERELGRAHAELPALDAALDAASARSVQAAVALLGVSTIDAIEAAVAERERSLLAEQLALDRADAARALATVAVEQARRSDRSAQVAVESARQALQQTQSALVSQQVALATAAGAAQAQRQQWQQILADLRRWAPLAEWLDAERHGHQAEVQQLAALHGQWLRGEDLRLQAQTAQAELQEQRSALAAVQAQLAELEPELAALAAALALAQAQLSSARETRIGLLAEPDIDAYALALDADVDRAQQRCTEDLARQHQAEQRHAAARAALEQALRDRDEAQTRAAGLAAQLRAALDERRAALDLALPSLEDLQALLDSMPADLSARLARWQQREDALRDLRALVADLQRQLAAWALEAGSARSIDAVNAAIDSAEAERQTLEHEIGVVRHTQAQDDQRRLQAGAQLEALEARRQAARPWAILDDLIGAGDGSKFKRYAQQFTLEVLIEYANEHIVHLARRYRLRRGNEPLSLLIVDSDLGDEVRSVHSLSGGETFLVSLALALGLASLSAQRLRVESLFIDEGFGSLDTDTLNTAMEALDRLQAQGRRIGVISHVAEMAERIGVQVRVEPCGAGRSVVRVVGVG